MTYKYFIISEFSLNDLIECKRSNCISREEYELSFIVFWFCNWFDSRLLKNFSVKLNTCRKNWLYVIDSFVFKSLVYFFFSNHLHYSFGQWLLFYLIKKSFLLFFHWIDFKTVYIIEINFTDHRNDFRSQVSFLFEYLKLWILFFRTELWTIKLQG